MPRDPLHRHGAALVTVVLLALAIFALAHGILVAALGELAASDSAERHLEARAAAEAALTRALGAPGLIWLDSVAVGDARGLPDTAVGGASLVTVRRLSAEAWWVEANARVGVASSRAATVAWAADPLTRVLALEGVVSVGPTGVVDVRGVLDATDLVAVSPPLDPEACAPWGVDLAAYYLSDPLAGVGALPDTTPSLGLLDFATVLAEADVVVAGAGSPAPVEVGGGCLTSEPWNWGDPERPWRPCGPYFPLVGAHGSLLVSGGSGQIVLAVDGDLVLGPGARLRGFVLTTGKLRLETGAGIEGLALAAGGVELEAGARVVGSGCSAVRALAAQRRTLGRLRPLPGAGLLGPL
jgi:hypothetical protein